MYSHDSHHSKSIQLHKMGQWAVTSDECTVFGGATPRCTVAAAHIIAKNNQGDLGFSDGRGHQPAVTICYHEAQQKHSWKVTRSSLLSVYLIVVRCKITEGGDGNKHRKGFFFFGPSVEPLFGITILN